MITFYDKNNENSVAQWERIFVEANKLLAAVGSDIKITTIDGYYSKIRDILDASIAKKSDPSFADPSVFMLLPPDETPFEINANTRTITVPAEFTRCAGVTGDNYCEFVTFKIDRYFDVKDLADPNIKILIKWKNAKNEEGASLVELKDTDYEYGKIRFGWPLTKEIASTAGNVTFSVEFYQEDATTTEKIYVLNTLPAIIPIRGGLELSGPIEPQKDVKAHIGKFLSNSVDVNYPIPVPPSFSSTNGAIDLSDADLVDDTLTLTALAIAPDSADVSYRWFYIPSGETIGYELGIYEKVSYADEEAFEQDGRVKYTKIGDIYTASEEYDSTEEYYILTGNGLYDIDKEFYQKTQDQEVTTLKNYYYKDGDIYKIVVDNTLIEYDDSAEELKYFKTPESTTSFDVYEKYTTLKIKPETDFTTVPVPDGFNEITGDYYVKAKSSFEINTGTENDSSHCIVAKPDEINFGAENLTNDLTLSEVSANNILTVKSITDASYSWRYTNNSNNVDRENNNINNSTSVGSNSNEITTLNPGWYQVHAAVSKNRYEEEAYSNICRVVDKPQAPIIKRLSWKNKKNPQSNYKIIFSTDPEDIINELTKSEYNAGDLIELKIEVDFDSSLDRQLITDQLSYVWYINANGNISDLNVTPTNEGNISTISVNLADGNNGFVQYACKITNTLNSQTAVLDSGIDDPSNDSFFFSFVG